MSVSVYDSVVEYIQDYKEFIEKGVLCDNYELEEK